MKKKFFSIAALVLISSTLSFGQFTFGISPGIGLNSSYVGYKMGKFVPYFGFQYLNVNLSYEYSGQEYDFGSGQIIPFSETSEFSGSLFIPNLGLKYFLKEHNQIKSFLSLNFSKPFVSGKLEFDGAEDPEIQETIDNISLWGGELSFGVEYFFDENFSLGGEFGLRLIHVNYEETGNRQIFDPNTGASQIVEVEDRYKFNMSPTFTRVSLNYYF
tara:strand:+ start:4612 stop:5256 length:645 start_codon:yes stop_codon:yes gene_type:complete